MRLLSEEDVIKVIDQHMKDDERLDDDVTCILEEVPTVNINLVEWLEEKCKEAQKEWDVYVVEEAIPERNAYLNVLNYLRMKGVIE